MKAVASRDEIITKIKNSNTIPDEKLKIEKLIFPFIYDETEISEIEILRKNFLMFEEFVEESMALYGKKWHHKEISEKFRENIKISYIDSIAKYFYLIQECIQYPMDLIEQESKVYPKIKCKFISPFEILKRNPDIISYYLKNDSDIFQIQHLYTEKRSIIRARFFIGKPILKSFYEDTLELIQKFPSYNSINLIITYLKSYLEGIFENRVAKYKPSSEKSNTSLLSKAENSNNETSFSFNEFKKKNTKIIDDDEDDSSLINNLNLQENGI